MIVIQTGPTTIKLCPDTPDEEITLDSWSNKKAHVINLQKTFEGGVNSLILEFQNE